jgi:hypothetical protein
MYIKDIIALFAYSTIWVGVFRLPVLHLAQSLWGMSKGREVVPCK